MMSEFGWDQHELGNARRSDTFLRDIEHDRTWRRFVLGSGEPNDVHGWQPLPPTSAASHTPMTRSRAPSTPSDGAAVAPRTKTELVGLYYTGISTLSHDAADMARAWQLLRAHGYRWAAFPPFQRTTFHRAHGEHVWIAALLARLAGAPRYTIQRAAAASGPWTTVCDRCVTDAGRRLGSPNASDSVWYQVIRTTSTALQARLATVDRICEGGEAFTAYPAGSRCAS